MQSDKVKLTIKWIDEYTYTNEYRGNIRERISHIIPRNTNR